MQANARPPIRIGVLLANNDESAFSEQFPSDAEKVCSMLRQHRPDWSYDIYSVKDNDFPRSGDADGFIITGSPASVHDALPWIARLASFIRLLDAERVPLIGLCFGHQVIAKALGGDVGQNPGGWRFGVATTRFTTRTAWMLPPTDNLALYACHSEQVTRLPTGAHLLGGNEFCPIGSFTIGEHILTTEYHPEFSREFMTSLGLAYRGEVPDAILEAGRSELQVDVQATVFAQWMIHFLEQDEGDFRLTDPVGPSLSR